MAPYEALDRPPGRRSDAGGGARARGRRQRASSSPPGWCTAASTRRWPSRSPRARWRRRSRRPSPSASPARPASCARCSRAPSTPAAARATAAATTWVWEFDVTDDEGRLCALVRMTVGGRVRRRRLARRRRTPAARGRTGRSPAAAAATPRRDHAVGPGTPGEDDLLAGGRHLGVERPADVVLEPLQRVGGSRAPVEEDHVAELQRVEDLVRVQRALAGDEPLVVRAAGRRVGEALRAGRARPPGGAARRGPAAARRAPTAWRRRRRRRRRASWRTTPSRRSRRPPGPRRPEPPGAGSPRTWSPCAGSRAGAAWSRSGPRPPRVPARRSRRRGRRPRPPAPAARRSRRAGRSRAARRRT